MVLALVAKGGEAVNARSLTRADYENMFELSYWEKYRLSILFGLCKICGWKCLLYCTGGLFATCWATLDWVSILEIRLETFLNNEVISLILCSSSLFFYDEVLSSLAFMFLSFFSTFALNLLDVDLLAYTLIALACLFAKVSDFISLSITIKSSTNALENIA